jgi:diguanylate cyclase (GGDEF)-like protein
MSLTLRRLPVLRLRPSSRLVSLVLVSIIVVAAGAGLGVVLRTEFETSRLSSEVSVAAQRKANLSNAQAEALRLVQSLAQPVDATDTTAMVDAVAVQRGHFLRQVDLSRGQFPASSSQASQLREIQSTFAGFPWHRLSEPGQAGPTRQAGMALAMDGALKVKDLFDRQDELLFGATVEALGAKHRSQSALAELVALLFVLGVASMIMLTRRARNDEARSYDALLKEMRVSRALQDDLTHRAGHDPLTGLADRSHMRELIEAALHRGQRAGGLVGVLFINLDHFKIVNDTLGHRGGDEILRTTAMRMRNLVRAGDTVGRLGGDEFVVLIEPLASPLELVALADRLITAVSAPVPIGGRDVTIGASIGAAVNLDGRTVGSKLLDNAEIAANRAKAAGRGRTVFFDATLNRELEDRADLEAAIRVGLAAGEFQMHYQPLVELSTGDVHGYEALIRWERPGYGLVPPDSFIPIAEQSNLICEIDNWVLRQATRQLAAWTHHDHEGSADSTIAVNISGRHLDSASIVTDVVDALQDAEIPAARLVLEITETVLVDAPRASVHLQALRELGVAISIDDFGTGYTSIGQLQNLNADILKIDRSFIATAGAGELIALMINAAHAFSLHVVAEGIEHDDQLALVRQLGCDSAQGFFFARPQPAASIKIGPGRPPPTHPTSICRPSDLTRERQP